MTNNDKTEDEPTVGIKLRAAVVAKAFGGF